jgi:hypothetical protein
MKLKRTTRLVWLSGYSVYGIRGVYRYLKSYAGYKDKKELSVSARNAPYRAKNYVAISKGEKMAFGKKKTEPVNPNEIVFTKTKGVGNINYAVAITKVDVGENVLSVERTNKVLFFKGKPKTDRVEYGQIAQAEIKTNFAKGDLISGIVLGVLAIILALTGAFGEEGPGIITGPIIIAVMLFCAYGKNIVLTRKDSSKVIIMSEGLGQGDEIEALKKKLAGHGVQVQGGK